MVKSYLKYEQAKTFGAIATGTTNINIVWTPNERRVQGAGLAVVGANEDVLVWNIKTGELLGRWGDERCSARATSIAQSKTDPDIFAVGYEDGSVRLWDRKISTAIVNFNGHRSAVTKLAFDRTGVRLASASKDTDIIVWDLVAEVGQYKLRGHKDQVTGLEFLEPRLRLQDEEGLDAGSIESTDSEGYLLTVGKDSLLKLWDLSSRHCIETHISQSQGECWALGLSPDLSGCITAGNDGEMKVWSLDADRLASNAHRVNLASTKPYLAARGTLQRQSKERATEVVFHPSQDYFAVHGSEKRIDIWHIRSESEVKKSLARRRQRRREKHKDDKLPEKNRPNDEKDDQSDLKVDVSDVFVQRVIVRTGGKVSSIAWTTASSSKLLQLVASTTNNQIEKYDIPLREEKKSKAGQETPDYERSLSVELPGHRSDVRVLALSSDDKMLASAANGSLKIWNTRNQNCLRTFDCGYSLCCAFLPGDKVVIVGTKNGELQLFDVASSSLLETITAHDGAVWSLHMHPNGRYLVTGGADKAAKFWDIKIVQEEILGTDRTTPNLKLVQSRILKLSDDILSLKFSPDARLLAVALLDNTVKVFFVDTLKLYLNLYGHKLPVLSMDISWDSKLIVTSSADKNLRIWGLDFGNCHKALFGHQDSILQVKFVPQNLEGNGHHFFSSSKDRSIRYWDGDKMEQIQRLNGHHGEVWALAISQGGDFLVSAGHDKTIRLWDQTDEQIFLEEEREKEIEELYESTLTTSLEKDVNNEDEDGEVAAASKRTTETLMAGERIQEALELGMADLNVMKDKEEAEGFDPARPPPQRNPIFSALGNISAEEHVMSVLQRIKASLLLDALLVLPFASVPLLFTFLNIFALRSMNIPLTCRILFFIIKTHHKQIVASRLMKAQMDSIKANLRACLRKHKDEMGVNLAALKIAEMRIRDMSVKDYVDESWVEDKISTNAKKRAFVQVA